MSLLLYFLQEVFIMAIMHTKAKGVADVDKFMNENGLRPQDVQIVYVYNPRGSYYMIFHEIKEDE